MSDTSLSSVTEQPALSLTAQAAARVTTLRQAQGNDKLMLRIAVSGGGCSGFQYGFSLDDTLRDDDLTFERDGVTVVVDEVSMDLLGGAEVDFVEEMIGSYFQIRNPNASSSCGCGSSFAV
ncbi:MAG: iron-sulfur cluster insertion protein ErpA [Alphaproteobacteria bacterium]|jgi:iron-sulfur cluster insertion protein|nr:iron-sulfur cluster insertion protein ErpA [Alphaproteobacteria bacterium]